MLLPAPNAEELPNGFIAAELLLAWAEEETDAGAAAVLNELEEEGVVEGNEEPNNEND